jgi:Na+-driven multidrug efflux pump
MGLVLTGALQPVKTLNMVLTGGVLRSGGDLRFAMGCEILMSVGIASAYILGVGLGFGYLGAMAGKACEEGLKLGTYLWRYNSRRWIHELG